MASELRQRKVEAATASPSSVAATHWAANTGQMKTKNIMPYVASMLVTSQVIVWSFMYALVKYVRVEIRDTVPDRIAMACQWNALLGTMLALFVLLVAKARGTSAQSARGADTDAVAVIRHACINTTEQAVIAICNNVALATILPIEYIVVVPGLVMVWLVGRVLFVLGYTSVEPMHRELGFSMTFVTSVVVAVYNCYWLTMNCPLSLK